jgi:hypothetical protein
LESGHDLVVIARIYSRPEMICYISALEAEGIHTFVTGNHHGSATQEIIALGGYLVRVSAAQVDQAVSLTAELRLETEPLAPALSQRRRLWMLVALLVATGGTMLLPFPITTPGDYRSKSGRMMQLR